MNCKTYPDQRKLALRVIMLCLLITLALIILTSVSRAETVFTSLGQLPGGGEGIRGGDAGLAVEFTPSSNFNFYSVQIPLAVDLANQPCIVTEWTTDCNFSAETAGVNVALMMGNPDVVRLDQLTEERPITITPSAIDFDCVTCPTLTAGTSYWFTLHNSSNDPLREQEWLFGTQSGLWAENFYGNWTTINSSSAPAFAVSGGTGTEAFAFLEAVPEPGGLILLATVISLARSCKTWRCGGTA